MPYRTLMLRLAVIVLPLIAFANAVVHVGQGWRWP